MTDTPTDDPADDPTDESTDESTDEPSDESTDERTGNSTDDPTDGPADGPAGADGTTDGSTDPPTDGPAEGLTEAEQEALLQEIERRRSHRGTAAVAVSVIAIAFSAYQMWLAARGYVFSVDVPGVGPVGFGQLQQLQINAVHVVFALVLAFLIYPPSTGDGFAAVRLARVVPAVRDRFGPTAAATRATERVRAGVRWAAVDAEMERVTPVDLAFVALAVATAVYYLTQFDEILQLRSLGLGAGVGVPIPGFGTVSYAYILGVVAVLLVLDATRRSLGVYLMAIVGSFIVYAKYGWLITPNAPFIGVFSITDTSWGVVIRNLWYTDQGILGVPVAVSVQFIYIFILFGAFLETSGAGKWFIDLAYAATGRRKGGPAKASILASGFMGTISGSSIANTVTTGAFTIPLMKRSGYRPEFAGAVEASASSGGQILPPVMGAAAFLIVEYTGTPYADVIILAAVPAVVFFFGVWVMVHLEASRVGIGGVEGIELVRMRDHMKHGWFYLLPLGLLLYYLIVERLSVARAAWFTLVAIMALIAFVAAYDDRTRIPLVVTILTLFAVQAAAYLTAGVGALSVLLGEGGAGLAPTAALFAAGGSLGTIMLVVSFAFMLARPDIDAPMLEYDDQVDEAAATAGDALGVRERAESAPGKYVTFILQSMDGGARTATQVVVAVAAAGIIPGVIATSGLGPNLTSLILSTAGTSLVLLLVITAIASIILGMGMPTTVTYIILISMLGPALAEGAGGPIVVAHLFILYFGVIADITPPVAVAAYAASGVAKSDPFQTGVEAFSLSLNKAIVPFAFILSPGILLLRTDGAEFHVLTAADLTDLGFILPEVVIPIAGVFVGVLALGPTIIGYLYTHVGRTDRVLFAVASLLLMAPLLLFNVANTLAGVVGAGSIGDPLAFDVALRGVGAVLFAVLVYRNRRGADRPGTTERPDAGTTTN